MAVAESVALKTQGNKLFNAGRLDDAIARYTEAIGLDPSMAVLFSNRSACYYQQQKFVLALWCVRARKHSLPQEQSKESARLTHTRPRPRAFPPSLATATRASRAPSYPAGARRSFAKPRRSSRSSALTKRWNASQRRSSYR